MPEFWPFPLAGAYPAPTLSTGGYLKAAAIRFLAGCQAAAVKIVELQAAINRYIDEHNHKPKSFIWKADPKRVPAAIERGKQALESIH